ncbi:MAG: hypothetical protein WAP51_03655 [Candidatus Sungiibacteriota bacterium]
MSEGKNFVENMAGLAPSEKETEFSRREFLKTAGTGLFAALAAGNAKEALALVEKAGGAGKEHKAGEPKVSFDIFYSAHETREDAKGLAERFRKADIYVPEANGWTEMWRRDMNAVSQGTLTPELFFRKRGVDPKNVLFSFDFAEIEMLYGSKKPVVFVDLPESHPLYRRTQETKQEINRFNLTKGFPEMLKKFTSDLKRFADVQVERERYMLQELKRLTERIQKGEAPEFKGKKDAKLLLFLGAAHTKIYHELKKSGAEAGRGFVTMPYVFGEFASEMFRRQMFGKPVNDELAARAVGGLFFRAVVINYAGYLRQDSHKLALLERKVVSRFSFNDIKSVFDRAQKSADTMGALALGFSEKFDEKKIKIPADEKELDEFLQK